MALLGPFAHVPDVLAHRRFEPTRIGYSRNFLQREKSILYVGRATKGLSTRSRIQIGAALAAFTAREHAHGVRRRAGALKDCFRPGDAA
jgi:hypothetical protein